MVKLGSMPEPPHPPGLLPALGMAIVGCLAFAAFTDEWLWVGVALLAAAVLSVWAWQVAKRQYADRDPGPMTPL